MGLRDRMLLLLIASHLVFCGDARAAVKLGSKSSRVARKTASLTKPTAEQKTVVDYFKCFEKAEASQVKGCTRRLLTKYMPKAEREQMNTWLLVYKFELLEFTKCSKQLVEQIRFYSAATNKYICGNLKLANAVKPAVFFFVRDGGVELKLRSVYL